MKAIKIPNAALLDVFGRPVAINSNDPHRPSLTPCISRAGFTETKSLNDAKNSVGAIVVTPKTDSEERLCVIGETPLHIAIVYNDMKSVKLLVKHGVDVNKRVVGDYNASIQSRKSFKNKEKENQRKFSSFLFRRSKPKTKQFNPQSENPESKTKRNENKKKEKRSFAFRSRVLR